MQTGRPPFTEKGCIECRATVDNTGYLRNETVHVKLNIMNKSGQGLAGVEAKIKMLGSVSISIQVCSV